MGRRRLAAVTAFACFRAWCWPERPAGSGRWPASSSRVLPVGAVFAWHEVLRAAGHQLSWRGTTWVKATVLGLVGAASAAAFLDPVLRPLTPEVYPTTTPAWLAQAFFTLAFAQLCLCFAPLAFALRLLPTPANALVAAVVWALGVTVLKFFGMPQAVPPLTAVAVLAARGAAAALSLWLYWEAASFWPLVDLLLELPTSPRFEAGAENWKPRMRSSETIGTATGKPRRSARSSAKATSKPARTRRLGCAVEK